MEEEHVKTSSGDTRITGACNFISGNLWQQSASRSVQVVERSDIPILSARRSSPDIPEIINPTSGTKTLANWPVRGEFVLLYKHASSNHAGLVPQSLGE